MKKPVLISVVLSLLMASSAAVSTIVAPGKKMADQREAFVLENQIPPAFGDWRIDRSVVPLQVDPETQARLNKIYNQTLSRTYVNGQGQRVMLSIAYGGDQSDNMGVHKPEICYVAQGFNVSRNEFAELATDYGRLPVKRLLAVSGERVEPITYWITVGNAITRPGFEQRMQELRYGLSGTVADGMLVRVSTIGSDLPEAYALHAGFVKALLAQMPAKDRARLIGVFPG
jgi:EpsI family protein